MSNIETVMGQKWKKRLEECAKAKSQLKVTDLFSSADGSESEGTDGQYKRVLRK